MFKTTQTTTSKKNIFSRFFLKPLIIKCLETMRTTIFSPIIVVQNGCFYVYIHKENIYSIPVFYKEKILQKNTGDQ